MKYHIGRTARNVVGVFLAVSLPVQAIELYQVPPPEVVDILEAPPRPDVTVSPDGKWLLLAHRARLASIDELAAPTFKAAGVRVNTNTNNLYDPKTALGIGFSLIKVKDGSERKIRTPRGSLGAPIWSPDSKQFAFTRDTATGVELWVASVKEDKARSVTQPRLSAAQSGGKPCMWMADSDRMLCHFVPEDRGDLPEKSVPLAPIVEESNGANAPLWTFANLLENPHDEALYEYYMTSQPEFVDMDSGKRKPIGPPGIYDRFEPSPSEKYFLSIRIVRPYSYLVPASRFPKLVEVLDEEGKRVRKLASLDTDYSGVGMGWAFDGMRDFAWLPDADAELVYVESLDGGDPNKKAEYRDHLMLRSEPFHYKPVELLRTKSRMGGTDAPIYFGEGNLALVSEFNWPDRRMRTWKVNTQSLDAKPELLWEHSTDDWYGDPGAPVVSTARNGRQVILRDGDWIYLIGQGGSPQGDHPFLDRFNLETKQTERLFHSKGESYENIVALLDDGGREVLTTYETQKTPANYYRRDLKKNEREALTQFTHSAPQLADVKKQRIEYTRKDGVPLTGELYLPVGYQNGEPVPTVIWAYPKEYVSSKGAGQVRGSIHKFAGDISPTTDHLLFLTQGYAVLDQASMPVVGGLKANDTFVEQLVANAQAAVDKLVEMGVTDRNKVGIGGHSYGAFMAANLLSHSDIFAAGITRSGAYNRSLTPFGFQQEHRSYWQAPEVYSQMSPLMHADKIKAPLLLIHGEADGNAGTFPMQSQRMYHALKGLGATARLVMLPYEDHVYMARESAMHVVWEMFNWFDLHVKQEGK